MRTEPAFCDRCGGPLGCLVHASEFDGATICPRCYLVEVGHPEYARAAKRRGVPADLRDLCLAARDADPYRWPT